MGIDIEMRRDYKGDPRRSQTARRALRSPASRRPLDFSPSISVRCFYDASPCTAFRERVGIAGYIQARGTMKRATPVDSSPLPIMKKKASGCSLSRPIDKRKIVGASPDSPRSLARECIVLCASVQPLAIFSVKLKDPSGGCWKNMKMSRKKKFPISTFICKLHFHILFTCAIAFYLDPLIRHL